MTTCTRADAGAWFNYPFLTSKERDIETGLDYFLARYYSSTQGRFTSPDEFSGGPDELYYFVDDGSANPTFYADLTNPHSLNKYQYAYNNPTRWVDPDGHDPNEAVEQNPVVPVPLPAPFPPVPIRLPTQAESQQLINAVDRALDSAARELRQAALNVTLQAALNTAQTAQIVNQVAPGAVNPNSIPAIPGTAPASQALPIPIPIPVQMSPRPIDKPNPRSHKNKRGKKSRDKDTRPRSGDKKPPNFKPRVPKRPQDMQPKPPKPPKPPKDNF